MTADTAHSAADPTAAAPARTAKLAALEGLRGLLAFVVCAGHLGLNDAVAPLGLHVRFDVAVDVFFALSGFVMTRAYYLGRRSFSALFASRVARLYPLHLLTMLWCLLLSYPGGFDAPLLAQNLLLVHNIGLPPNRWAFNFPSWSISVEMVVSLAFFFVMRRDRPGLAPLLLAAGVALSAYETASGLTPALNHHAIFNSGLLRGLAGFALGATAYLATLQWPVISAQLGRTAPLAALALVAFFLMRDWWWLSSALFALTVFAAVLGAATAGAVPILSSRPLVWLGAVSYSVYLLHIPLYWSASAVFGPMVETPAGKLALLATVLAASGLCYRAFELPMQRWLLAVLVAPKGRRA